MLLLRDRHDVPGAVEDQAARRRGALVDRRHISLFHRAALILTTGSRRARGIRLGRPRARRRRAHRAAGAPPAAAPAARRYPSRRRSAPHGRRSARRSTPAPGAARRSRPPSRVRATRASSRSSRSGSQIVASVIGRQPGPRHLRQRERMMREQHLAQRGRVGRQQRADIERLQAVIGTEDMVDDQHLALVQGSDPDRLAACAQRASPTSSARAYAARCRRGSSNPCAAARPRAGTCRVSGSCSTNPTCWSVRSSPCTVPLERLSSPARSTTPSRRDASREQPQDRRCALDRLDVSWQGGHSRGFRCDVRGSDEPSF